MPDSLSHGKITQCALDNCLPLTAGDNGALVKDYCCYPDDFYGPRSNEIRPYTYMKDGIQFHYPPHTPYEEVYRYWNVDAEGHFHHSHPFVNHNFEYVMPGFKFYLSHVIECLQRHEEEDARKYLGCLLHMLEDSTFAMHALEGPGGADAFLLDRLVDSRDFPVRPSYIGAKINAEECQRTEYAPHSLGRNVDEAAMRLYARYVAAASDSRRCVFSYILKANQGYWRECRELVQRMFDNAVKICSDITYTLFAIAGRADATPPPCHLTDMEPHIFPFGGFRPYRYTAFERNYAVGMKDERLPLKLMLPDGAREYPQGLSFGTHSESDLLFWIAPGSFDGVRLQIGFHPDLHFGKADLQIINDGKTVDEISLDEMACTLTLNPHNLFGFHIKSNSQAGCICLIG